LSPPFEEPKDGAIRVFQCKNGNTLLLEFITAGIRVTAYDANHRNIARNILAPGTWEGGSMKSIDVLGIFNIGEDVAVFVETDKNGPNVLTRISLSTQDGKMLSYAKLSESHRIFYVNKASENDAYAITLAGSESENNVTTFKFLYFDEKHTLTGSDSFATSDRFKYKRFLGTASKAPGQGIMCLYQYNTRSSGGKESRLSMISFRGGQFQQITLDSAQELRETNAIMLYNPKADLYEIVTAAAEGAEGGMFKGSTNVFSCSVLGLRAKDFQFEFVNNLDERELVATRKERYGRKYDYAGLPVNATVARDGSLTVITESMSLSTDDHGTNTTYLGDIGLLRYDASGKLISSTLVPNSQIVARAEFDPLYQKGEDLSKVWFHRIQKGLHDATEPGYYYSRYIETTAGAFVFQNQHEDDFDRGLDDYPNPLKVISPANAVGYRINDSKLNHFHLFGEPGENFQNRFALFSSGDYSPVTKSFAVVIIERKKHEDKMARIAWLQFKDSDTQESNQP
jgi:hypothetical protein